MIQNKKKKYEDEKEKDGLRHTFFIRTVQIFNIHRFMNLLQIIVCDKEK